jgi:hypothetical protein
MAIVSPQGTLISVLLTAWAIKSILACTLGDKECPIRTCPAVVAPGLGQRAFVNGDPHFVIESAEAMIRIKPESRCGPSLTILSLYTSTR